MTASQSLGEHHVENIRKECKYFAKHAYSFFPIIITVSPNLIFTGNKNLPSKN